MTPAVRGDGHGDISRLNAACPVYEVRGNCDLFSRQPDEQLLQFEDVKLLLAHGHLLGVKRGLSKLALHAKAKGAAPRCMDTTTGKRSTSSPGALHQPRGLDQR